MKKAIIGVLLVLTGCATIKDNVAKTYHLNQTSGKGVLLTSLTYRGSYAGKVSLPVYEVKK